MTAAKFNSQYLMCEQILFTDDMGNKTVDVIGCKAWEISNGTAVVGLAGRKGGVNCARISKYQEVEA